MPTPIERILAEWSRIATDLTRGGYDDPADALDAAITAALEAEREMNKLIDELVGHPVIKALVALEKANTNRLLGGE